MKVLIGILILAGLYFGNEIYWQNKFEDQYRQSIKSLQLRPEDKKAFESMPFDMQIHNQYPEIINITKIADDFDTANFDVTMAEMTAHQQSCDVLKDPKLRSDSDYRKAALSVIDKDSIVVTHILKHGTEELFKISRSLKECGLFNELKKM